MTKPKNIIISLGVSSIYQVEQDPFSTRHVSEVVVNILKAISIVTPKARVFFLSSAAVCGKSQDIGIVEDIQPSAISLYGVHKIALETLVNKFTAEHRLNMCIIRIFSVFGRKQLKHVIWEIYSQLVNKESVKLYGEGTEKRDFILIDDLAKQFNSLLSISDPLPKIINLGSGQPIQIIDLAYNIREILGFKADVKFTGVQNKFDPKFLYPDLALANSLGIPSGNSLDIGLKQTIIEWQGM
jgi:UDP-glucose 4-epimerase